MTAKIKSLLAVAFIGGIVIIINLMADDYLPVSLVNVERAY